MKIYDILYPIKLIVQQHKGINAIAYDYNYSAVNKMMEEPK